MLYVSVTDQENRPYIDPSTRYRAFNPVEGFRRLGHLAYVTTQSALPDIDPGRFDLIVVHRPHYEPPLIDFIERCRDADVRLVADYDDLLFNSRFALQSSFYKQDFDPELAADFFRKNTSALRLFDTFTVSTSFLAECIRELLPSAQIFHFPNSVPPSLGDMIDARHYERSTERHRIGYFPGTRTHEEDFGIARDAVIDFCRTSGAEFLVVGPLRLPAAVQSAITAVEHPLVDFEEMFDLLATCRVVIAPLVSNAFNCAKSHIKLLEASLAGASTCYTSIGDMSQHECAASYAVHSEDEWPRTIARAWDEWSPARGVGVRGYFLANCDVLRWVQPLVEFLALEPQRVGVTA